MSNPIPTDNSEPTSSGGLSAPKVDASGRPQKKAIETAQQAHGLAKQVRQRAVTTRILTAGIIAEKYNGGSPWSQQDLKDAGEDWRNNFSTNFIASIVDRVKPQLLDPIKNSDVLTRSMLPPGYEDGPAKSKKFQEVISRTIREWTKWDDATSQLSQEIVLNGCCAGAHLGDDWRPLIPTFGSDYMPEETGQHALDVAFRVIEERRPLHKFMEILKDREIAEKAGYVWDDCVKAANSASGVRGDLHKLEEQDLIREGATLTDTYTDGQVRMVNLMHVLVQDYSGSVDLWTVERENGYNIRNVEGIHKKMDDGTTLFTFQSGNGTYYGSKGLGRLLVNLHIAIERLRNLGADQAYLAGLVILIGKAAGIHPKVLHPFIILPESGVLVQEQRIEFDATAHQQLLNDLIQIAESIAGAFVPPNVDQGNQANTKIEAAQKAEREIAVKQGVLGRFAGQFSNLVFSMQRKICSATNLREARNLFAQKQMMKTQGITAIENETYKLLVEAFGEEVAKTLQPVESNGIGDSEAVNAIIEMLEFGLTIEEIARLAVTPSATSSEDNGDSADQRVLTYIAANKMNPFLDQRKAAEMEAKIAIGEARATSLLIPDQDPNVEAKAARDQRIEFSEMLDGNPMPVVADDNHMLHRKALAGMLTPLMVKIEDGSALTPQSLQAATLALQHYNDHLNQDAMTGDDMKKKEMPYIKQWEGIIAQAGKALQAQQQAAAQQQSQPGQPQENQPPTDPKAELEAQRIKMESAVHLGKLSHENERLKLDAEKFQHQKDMDTLNAANQTTATVAKIAADTHKTGMDEAALDLERASATTPAE